MATKQKAYLDRVAIGNSKAEAVAKYCEKLWKQPLTKAPVEQDIDDKVDYVLVNTGQTIQIHCRESGSEFIFEQYKFRKNSTKSRTRFRREPGRDTLCKAVYMVMVPSSQDQMHTTKMSNLKKLVEEAEQEWLHYEQEHDPEMEIYSDRWIGKFENLSDGKCRCLHKTKNGITLFFKIDEGSDGNRYSKLLYFIPPNLNGVLSRPYNNHF